MVCAGPRPAMRDTLATDALRLKPVGGKVQQGEAAPAGHDGSEDFVDVAAEKDLAAGQVDPGHIGVLAMSVVTSAVVSSSAGLRCQMLHVLQRYWHQ